MDVFVLVSVAVISAMTGFWMGRSMVWRLAEAEGPAKEEPTPDGEDADAGEAPGERRAVSGAKGRKNVKTLSQGREIGSPVTGQISVFEENGACKVRMLPDQGRVYAPAAGKIRRLYPMGSAMLLKTEFGAEIMIRAGSHVNEMCSGYYRCRVMEHEFVRKGTLLLEYDPAGIRSEGAEPELILSVENESEFGKVTVTAKNRMKAGETVLYIEGGKHLSPCPASWNLI